MIPEAEICHNYFPPKIYEKDYTIGQISVQKIFPDCKVVSGTSTGSGKSKGAEYFLWKIQNLPFAGGQEGIANMKPGKGQQQQNDSVKNLKVMYPTDGQCTPWYDTLTYIITTPGSNSNDQAGQFHMIYGRRTRV